MQATSGDRGVQRSREPRTDRDGLLINALKHAFPSGEKGDILVSYGAEEFGWQLSVSDNGTGAQEKDGEPPHTGLGTSIVEVLAHQLKATVQKKSGPQGSTVTITASAVAAEQE